MVDETLVKPNGLAFSPDYSILYIVDTGASHKPGHPRTISAFDVVDGKSLANGRIFCDMGNCSSDGIRVDIDGNVWSAAGWAAKVPTASTCSPPTATRSARSTSRKWSPMVCFGGVKRNRLFMTGSQSLYSLYVETQGAPYV